METFIAAVVITIVALGSLALAAPKLDEAPDLREVCQWCGQKFDAWDLIPTSFVYDVQRGNLPFIFQETTDRWAGKQMPMFLFWQDESAQGTSRLHTATIVKCCAGDQAQMSNWMSGYANRVGASGSQIDLPVLIP